MPTNPPAAESANQPNPEPPIDWSRWLPTEPPPEGSKTEPPPEGSKSWFKPRPGEVVAFWDPSDNERAVVRMEDDKTGIVLAHVPGRGNRQMEVGEPISMRMSSRLGGAWLVQVAGESQPQPVDARFGFGSDACLAPLAYEAPALTPVHVRREVSTTGRDGEWVDYGTMVNPDAFGSYPFWRIWRGTELQLFRARGMFSASVSASPCSTHGCTGEVRHVVEAQRTPMCTDCYRKYERTVAAMTPANVETKMRVDMMNSLSASGLTNEGHRPRRACNPTLFGGVINLRTR